MKYNKIYHQLDLLFIVAENIPSWDFFFLSEFNFVSAKAVICVCNSKQLDQTGRLVDIISVQIKELACRVECLPWHQPCRRLGHYFRKLCTWLDGVFLSFLDCLGCSPWISVSCGPIYVYICLPNGNFLSLGLRLHSQPENTCFLKL